MTKTSSVSALAFLLLLATTKPASAQWATETWMRVAKHSNVASYTLTSLNNRFASATSAFQTDSGTNDVACTLTVIRADAGWSFFGGNTTDVINTQGNFDGVLNNVSDAYVNVVNTINWCGAIGPFNGCAYINAFQGLVVKRSVFIDQIAGGTLLAHEFGHSTGLYDAPAGSPAFLVMDGSGASASNEKVSTNTECLHYRTAFQPSCPSPSNNSGPPSSAICSPVTSLSRLISDVTDTVAVASPPAGAEIIQDRAEFNEVPIELLAQRLIADRMPIEVEEHYGPEDVTILKRMLQDPANELHQQTILALIGLISDGTDDDVDVVANYKGSEISAAMIALGYIANRTGSTLALDTLLDRFSGEDRNFVTAAALGLAVSGDSEAVEALTTRARTVNDINIGRELFEIAREGELMNELGFRAYYLAAVDRLTVTFEEEPTGSAFPLDEPSDGTKEVK